MKKLIFLFAAVLLTAISANVFAQSTGETPAPGATHEYSITPGNVANTIAWTVLEDDLTTVAAGVTVASASSATTDITWGAGLTVGDWYYVQVVETDGGGCSNTKVLPVQITASPFYLEIIAANATQCYDGAVVVSLADPSTVNYDHGNATIEFTVTPYDFSTSYTGYSFDIDLDFGAFTGLDASNVSVSANASIAGGTVTVTDNAAVTITYVVDNTNTYDNSSAVDAQDYTGTATISNGETSNGVADNGADGTYVDATDVGRPNTSGISTN
ncbi:hypothetical protein [uncultured Draconibacterium sp.]|uniref:hypothetical protein n=1 Tax=uncultured Draconibacterium sp. TaxID=1573823 RepID=UPI0032611A57